MNIKFVSIHLKIMLFNLVTLLVMDLLFFFFFRFKISCFKSALLS